MNFKKLAELIGIILGDGHLHTKENKITITGSLEDKHYYEEYVIPLIKKLFPSTKPSLKKRNDRNSYYIVFNSKEVMETLVNLGMIRGNKINAKIPTYIKNNVDLSSHFLRGLFDTDGCLKFSKQGTTINYYPRIQLAFKETNFSKELFDILQKTNIVFARFKDKRGSGQLYYTSSGKNNLELWMKIIGSNNPVHKSKYEYYKQFGHYLPKSSLNSRIKALNLKRAT